RRKPRPESGAAEKAPDGRVDGPVAVMAEQNEWLGRLVLGEEVFDEVGPTEPPVVIDVLVDDEVVVVDDVAAPGRKPVSGYERMVLCRLRKRCDGLGGKQGRPHGAKAAPSSCGTAARKTQKEFASGCEPHDRPQLRAQATRERTLVVHRLASLAGSRSR